MQDEHNAPRAWLSVDQAFVACQQAGLDRTKKTIRSWARNEHVEAQKQTTPTGERWMVEKTSLSVKIRSELEFQAQSHTAPEPVQPGANQFEPVRATDEPVHTGPDASEPRRTEANHREPAAEIELEELRREVRSLEIDKAVRDRQIDFLTKQNENGQKNLLSQSRYIGHLETQVLQLGGAPDQAFLKAPVQRTEPDANPHQGHFRDVE